MLNCLKSNKIIPLNQKVKVFLNDGNCKNCDKKDMLIIDDNGNGFCERCKINNIIFKYVSSQEHQKIKNENIKVTTFHEFISKSDLLSSFI
jgi:hypothetical protein